MVCRNEKCAGKRILTGALAEEESETTNVGSWVCLRRLRGALQILFPFESTIFLARIDSCQSANFQDPTLTPQDLLFHIKVLLA